MPTLTLTDVDLTDPAPPVPGDTERAAVHARAGQIVRRRRARQRAGVLVAMVALGAGVVALAWSGSSNGPAPAALLHVRSASLEQGSKVTAELRNDDRTFEGVADANGTVHFDPAAAAGTYRVFITVESPPGAAEDGVDIGTSMTTYRSITITLHEGINQIDLDQLTPEAPTTAVTR